MPLISGSAITNNKIINIVNRIIPILITNKKNKKAPLPFPLMVSVEISDRALQV